MSLVEQLRRNRSDHLDGLQLSAAILFTYRTSWDLSQITSNPLIYEPSEGAGDNITPSVSPLERFHEKTTSSLLSSMSSYLCKPAFPFGTCHIFAFSHYHLVGLLHNTPFRDLVAFASWETQKEPALESVARLMKWRSEGPRARRALFHAGALFTHIKDHCRDEYYGAIALTVAALVLWAYTSLDHHMPEAHGATRNTIRFDKVIEPSRLKRWIAEDTPTRLFITEIGDLSQPDTATRIIEVASQTLAATTSWGITDVFIRKLSLLNVK